MYNFAVISDPQIDTQDPRMNEDYLILNKCFNNMEVDSVVVCGDITENAVYQEWDMFFKSFKEHCKDAELQYIPGNMDYTHTLKGRETLNQAFSKHFNYTQEKLYRRLDTDYCVFFGLAVEKNSDEAPMSERQLQELDKALAYATENGISAIVYGHYILNDTIKVNWDFAYLGTQSHAIKRILEKHDTKVLFFSGHTHKGLVKDSYCTVVEKNGVTYISTPSICQPDDEHYPGSITDRGTGFLVTVTRDSIEVQGYNFLENLPLPEYKWNFNK